MVVSCTKARCVRSSRLSTMSCQLDLTCRYRPSRPNSDRRPVKIGDLRDRPAPGRPSRSIASGSARRRDSSSPAPSAGSGPAPELDAGAGPVVAQAVIAALQHIADELAHGQRQVTVRATVLERDRRAILQPVVWIGSPRMTRPSWPSAHLMYRGHTSNCAGTWPSPSCPTAFP